MFADAVRDRADGITTNPFGNVKRQRSEGRRHIVPLTRQEVETLISCAEEALGEYGRDVYGPLLTVAAWSGLRPAELFALEWRDITDGELLVGASGGPGRGSWWSTRRTTTGGRFRWLRRR
jgi:integrase